MRKLYASLFVLLTLCPFVYSAPVDSTCQVIAKGPAIDDIYKGSGTVIACENDYSLIMTCAHIAENPDWKYSIWMDGKVYPATYFSGSTVIEKDGDIEINGPDLALLVTNVKLKVVEIGVKPPKVGQKVHQYGFAGGDPTNGPFYKEGKVLNLKEFFSTADARPGDSGSGLFNADDELVGVVNMRPRDLRAVGGYAIGLDTIREFLCDNEKCELYDLFTDFQKKVKGDN